MSGIIGFSRRPTGKRLFVEWLAFTRDDLQNLGCLFEIVFWRPERHLDYVVATASQMDGVNSVAGRWPALR